MYGLVLMAALTTATDSVDCHRGYYYGGWGRNGWYSSYGSCYGWNGYYRGWSGRYYMWNGPAYYYGDVIVAGEDPRAPAPATIVVTLPADAKLTIGDSPTTSTSGTRTFVSPLLERGSTYVYTIRADHNGQSQSQEIRVRPGEITQAQFSFPAASVAGR